MFGMFPKVWKRMDGPVASQGNRYSPTDVNPSSGPEQANLPHAAYAKVQQHGAGTYAHMAETSLQAGE